MGFWRRVKRWQVRHNSKRMMSLNLTALARQQIDLPQQSGRYLHSNSPEFRRVNKQLEPSLLGLLLIAKCEFSIFPPPSDFPIPWEREGGAF